MTGALLAVVVVVVFVIPYVFIKHLSWGIHRRGRGRDGVIGLTFDDGPDPEATPRLLEVLRRHGIKATFFVKGDEADVHPELVRRLVAEGHDVGSHSYHHRHALFHRVPLSGYFDTRKGIMRLDALLGRNTQFFRPPWGAYSWSVFFAIKRSAVRPIHWTVEAHDWHPRFAPSDVVRKVLAEAKPGGIIVMHDGGRGAAKSVHAIEPILVGLKERGLRPVPLSQMELK